MYLYMCVCGYIYEHRNSWCCHTYVDLSVRLKINMQLNEINCILGMIAV